MAVHKYRGKSLSSAPEVRKSIQENHGNRTAECDPGDDLRLNTRTDAVAMGSFSVCVCVTTVHLIRLAEAEKRLKREVQNRFFGRQESNPKPLD